VPEGQLLTWNNDTTAYLWRAEYGGRNPSSASFTQGRGSASLVQRREGTSFVQGREGASGRSAGRLSREGRPFHRVGLHRLPPRAPGAPGQPRGGGSACQGGPACPRWSPVAAGAAPCGP